MRDVKVKSQIKQRSDGCGCDEMVMNDEVYVAFVPTPSVSRFDWDFSSGD